MSMQADRQAGRRAGGRAGRQADGQAGGQAGRQAGWQAGRLSLPFEWTGLHSGRLQLILDQGGNVAVTNTLAYYALERFCDAGNPFKTGLVTFFSKPDSDWMFRGLFLKVIFDNNPDWTIKLTFLSFFKKMFPFSFVPLITVITIRVAFEKCQFRADNFWRVLF